MDEQNKQPEPNKPEKKLSRTTLTFYIVGLFSVAIALILISYVAQSRADKQVENLNSQLTQQQTVAQGATQKVEDLQEQYDLQNTALEKVRKLLDSDQAATDVVGATKQRMEEREVYSMLASINASLYAGNIEDAKRIYAELTEKYNEDRLLGNADEGSFPSDINKMFEALQKDEKLTQDADAQPDESDTPTEPAE